MAKRIAVLVSGGGTNLQALIDTQQKEGLGGGSLVDYTLEHPVAIALFIVAVILLVLPFFRKKRDKRTCEPNF